MAGCDDKNCIKGVHVLRRNVCDIDVLIFLLLFCSFFGLTALDTRKRPSKIYLYKHQGLLMALRVVTFPFFNIFPVIKHCVLLLQDYFTPYLQEKKPTN